jgi:hypothetical protein
VIFSQNLKVYLELAIKAFAWARRGFLERNAVIVEVWLDSFQRSGLSVALCLTHSLGCTIREKLDISSELI